MRDQGRLIEWFDDKGYGFIQPQDSTKDRVFLHIKNFSKPGPRPIVGCALEYTVILDAKSRFNAIDVVYLKAHQTRKTQTAKTSVKQHVQKNKPLKPMQIACVTYIVMIGLLTLIGWLTGGILLLLCLINIITYWCYAQDKEAAQRGNRRISEQALHILSFLGGWPAAWLAQQKFRHKTQKQTFQYTYYCTIILNILLMIWWISPLNHLHF
jgi:uncharacterized membrane protein YsdA (DUF1294 family)/cold shock CspA family protein